MTKDIRKHLYGIQPDNLGMINYLKSRYRMDAARRNYTFNLSTEAFGKIIKESCHYCGIEGGNKAKTRTYPEFYYNGIDRIDNNRGYVEGNIVACCGQCNRSKTDMTRVEFLAWAARIVEHQDRVKWYDFNKDVLGRGLFIKEATCES